MTRTRAPYTPALMAVLAAGLLALPAAAQPILIPLSPQARDQSPPRPAPVPVPVAPPQADATAVPQGPYGAAPAAEEGQDTARTGRAEPEPTR